MSDPLDVAVNLLWLAPGRVGGSEQYLTRQLAGLPDDARVAPRLLCQPSFPAAHPELGARFALEPMPLDRDWRGARIVAEHTWLAARSRRADVVHHGGGTVPVGSPGPVVLTIHDVQYLRFPEHFSPARLTYLRSMVPRSARRAAVITTPSAYVRSTVIEAFHVDEEDVVVVPHGVPELVTPSAELVRAATERIGVAGRPYLVYPAITHPHKRHHVLIDMLERLDDDVRLVLIGGEGAAESDLRRAIETAGLGDRVVRPGRVGETDRDALVAGAQALVFPSQYEGFGAPLIEAMMLATPVVCGDHPAVREVVGEAAVVVSEPTGEAWAAAVRDAIGRRHALVTAGRDRCRRFTLAASGAALAAAYDQAAQRT